MRFVPITIGALILTPAIAFGGFTYLAWSHYDLALASDDFWDRCRHSASAGNLPVGRYEAVVWSQIGPEEACQDVRGYCMVEKRVDGPIFGDALEEHQIFVPAESSTNCTYLGWMSSEQSPFKRVN